MTLTRSSAERDIGAVERQAFETLASAASRDALESLRVRYLGKKAKLTALLRAMKDLPAEDRPAIGAFVNQAKERVERALEEKLAAVRAEEEAAALAASRVDVTLPGRRRTIGRLSPLTQVRREVTEIFRSMGFSVEEGPEVETEYYNFDALNFPPDHPSRDAQDTLLVDGGYLLRTHTSPVQIRTMERQKPPVRMICPGWVYRADTLDASHSPMFSQVEGLLVDEGVSLGDLFGILNAFAQRFFGERTKTRYRPSFFPFTEPSAEVDVSCMICAGTGKTEAGTCRVCKGTGWKEILGCGMVDPNVFKAVGYDSERYTGFAFGMGIERLAMFKFGVDEIRHFFEGDQRFIAQF
ncbi:MAG: phenylalanine--tRNA ligase subunit alpha [Deltaproteobacteria bacterium]|nr:phenylalanine--tRNA ligase subunit alpha [Deltaproteobacteria bacterium]